MAPVYELFAIGSRLTADSEAWRRRLGVTSVTRCLIERDPPWSPALSLPASNSAPPTVTLRFDRGTLVLDGPVDALADRLEAAGMTFDLRIARWRAPAACYRDLFAALHRAQEQGLLLLDDRARTYGPLALRFAAERTPRFYQSEAIEAWNRAGRRGLVVLPTGAGKSLVAHLAIAAAARDTLIVVPTIDLMLQWHDGLRSDFGLAKVGLLGGGSHEIEPITVTTYDSFHIHAERIGHRFGLVVYDEVHHLPGPSYILATDHLLAPFRLGLTATPERPDNRHLLLDKAVGPTIYRREIRELAGEFLADYTVETLRVSMSEPELEDYTAARQCYLDFVRQNRISMGSPGGWARFIALSSRTPDGRAAFAAYREQRRLALASSGKLAVVEQLLQLHRADRSIIFTHDNATVFELSRRLLLPSITHRTGARERAEILARFRSGEYRTVVTSKVLNEGVDVPDAGVAIVLSGSSTQREQVQRLGRVLRKREGKQAVLYEIITRDTIEEQVAERRKEHDAFR